MHHLQHDCSTFAADAAKNKNAEKAPVSGTDTVSSCVQDDRSLFAADLKNTETPLIAGGDGGGWVCDPAICCKRNERLDDCTGMGNLDSEPALLVCSSLLQTDANVPQNISPAANNQDQEPAAIATLEISPIRRWHRLAVLLPRGSRSPDTAGLSALFFSPHGNDWVEDGGHAGS